MTAVKTLNEALVSMRDFGVRHRTRNAISFGTFEECKCILRRTMLRIDETIEDFEWLEQYDEVAQWMSNTEGRGLFLRGGCGVGKTADGVVRKPSLFLMICGLPVSSTQAAQE